MSFPLPGFIPFALKVLYLSSTLGESTVKTRGLRDIRSSINREIEGREGLTGRQVQGYLRVCREAASNFYRGVQIQLGSVRFKALTLDRKEFAASRSLILHSFLFMMMWVGFIVTPSSAYGKTTPTLTVATSGTPSTYGGSVTFTATISSGPTGTITFLDGTTSLGTGNISGTHATYTTGVLAAGSHSITASYAGNSSYNAVTSSAITQTVNKSTPTLTVATSGTPSTFGASVTFTATISSGPTGTVTFYDGGTSIGTGTISGTSATRATSVLTGGTHSITASWPGNTNYNSVTSSAITQTVNKATPTISWATPGAIAYGTALSATQLNASTTPAGSFAYSPASGTVLGAGPHTLSVTFTPTDNTDYNSNTATVTQTVNKATPTISWATPAAITYGTALSTIQLNALTTPAGSFAYTPASGTVLGAGSQSLSVTFTPTDTTDYNGATATVTQTVNKATPAISWATPAAISYGTALSTTQLNAWTNPAGSFAYTPASGTVLGAGSHSLSVTFTPADATDYNSATSTVSLTVSAIPGPGVITTIVGNGGWGYSGDGGPAVNAQLKNPIGVAVDLSGGIYVSDSYNYRIRQVNATTGNISTIGGNGTSGYSGDGSLAINAELMGPGGVAVDAAGNTYFSDGGGAVRKINASTGIITTVAGHDNWGFSGDGGPATNAELSYDIDVAVDSAGNLYIADRYNMRIRKVSAATGIITTIAGNGDAGYSGDGGPATSAALNWPFGVAVDALGNIYIADLYNNVVRKVTASSGIISTIAGNGTAGYTGDGGPATSAEINGPFDVALDAAGNLYITDSNNYVIRQVAAGTGIISTFAGNGTQGISGDGGPATGAQLESPWDIATDAHGNLLIADFGANDVRMVGSSVTEPSTTSPTITWSAPSSIQYGTALSATQLNATASVQGTFTYTPSPGAVLPAGLQSLSVLFTPSDTGHYSPVMATVPLTVTTATPSINWSTPTAIVYGWALSAAQLNATANVPGTFAYVPAPGTILTPGSHTLSVTFTPTDIADYAIAVASVTLNVSLVPGAGIITTVAGNGYYGYAGDGGPAISADVSNPGGVALDAAGNIYIASYGSNVIRKVAASTGIITTVAGTGVAGYSGDGGPATSAELNGACGLAVDTAGNIYIADGGNSRVRKVDAITGIITTVAGNGVYGYSGDGGAATNAAISGINNVALDTAGNLYIPDEYNNRIRKVAAGTGIITTVAGTGAQGYSGDGGLATNAQLSQPAAVAVDSSSNIYISDGGNNVIRKVNASTGGISTIAGNGTAGYAGDGGSALSSELNLSEGGVALDSAGNLYITDANNNVIRLVTASSGVISTIAGDGINGYSGDGGPATSAELAATKGVAVDSVGNLYIADIFNNRVREVGAPYSSSTCIPSNGYSYVRQIVIDHTKVPNSDQANFQFLFNAIDPTFATTSNGGRVTNSSGYDIIFSTDPSGQTRLDHELEQYNPATGQITAWVRIPTLSHSTDTTIYLFYGNSQVTTSQQNRTGVWDSNYMGVWHLPNGTTLSTNDSTSNGHNGTDVGATAASGKIGGGARFSGSNYIDVGNLGNFPTQGTIDFWMNPSVLSSYPNAFTTNYNGVNNGIRFEEDASGDFSVAVGNGPFNGYGFMTQSMRANTWYHVGFTWNTSTSSVTGFLNGAQVFNSSNTLWPSSIPNLAIGSGYSTGRNWIGLIDEARISTVARSVDWFATEYNNQSVPESFYKLGTESAGVLVSPGALNLYASEAQKFTATVFGSGSCLSSVLWSMPSDSPGTLTADGLYTAPSPISAAQTVLVTATTQSAPSISGTAAVTLLPVQNPMLSLSAAAQPPYVVGASEQFVATLKNSGGTPMTGISVSFTVAGVNPTNGSSTTNSSGVATFSYTGSHTGTDSIRASISITGASVNSNSVSAQWLTPVLQISTTTVAGDFFLSDGSGPFDTLPTALPAFSQSFPTINFNPPSGTVPGNTSSVDVNTRPFTDVTTDQNGNFTGTIIAQGNGYQAGVGAMLTFQAVFRGAFTVASAGNVTFNFYTDDGFILGIGNGATRVSGASRNMPAFSPFEQYPVMGAYDDASAPVGNQVVVYFPAAGTYPYEIDYTECCLGQLVLTMTQGASSPTGIAPTGSLTLTPNSVQPLPIGGTQVFTVLASDASGNPIANQHVGLVISGADNLQLSGTTDSTGHVTIAYHDVNPGTATVQAVGFVSGMVTYSNSVSVQWSGTPATSTNNNGGNGSTLSISVSAQNTVILPSNLQLSATVSDTALQSGGTISVAWSQVSGPGTVTFTPANSTSTVASFSEPGGYVLKLSASDPDASDSVTIAITVNPAPNVSQGWIGSPANGSTVSGIVPITVASGETLQSGTLTFYPANNATNVTVLNANTTGSGQIGKLDTTTLANGQYWITLQATDTNGSSSYNLALVTVVGNYKPGRVTSTVTDLVVPAKGLAIQIQRTYDSLNAGTSSDFGYGWNIGTNVNLSVNPLGSVTFTLGGQRRTFYLTPQYGGFLPFYVPVFTPEPGLHGTLINAGSGCSDFFDYLVPDGSLWACVGGGFWTPPGYVYTDPSGTSYTMTASGQLQSIADKNGNALIITAAGISSSTGLSVPFVRDASGRITKITDPQGNQYLYGYDASGNLESVTYPNTPQSSSYTYDSNHRYLSGTDFRNNPLPTTTYYASTDTDSHGNPLGGRLETVTDGLGEKTTYTYDLTTRTTTITYPPDSGGSVGTATMVYDTMGDLLSSKDPLNHITTNTYDAKQNLLSTTDPMGYITCYTYDANGNRTSVSLPQTGPSCSSIQSTTAYNQFSEPTSTTDELGNVRTFNYDVNFNPRSVTDSSGTLASFAFNNDGTMQAGAIGVDINANPSTTSQFAYDADGNMASRTDALGRTTSYTYDSLGHKLTMVEPLPPNTSASAATTTYSYDAFGNLTQTAAPLGRTTSSTYDGNGNKLSDTDARSNATTYTYDALNRLSTTTYPTSPVTTSSKTYDFRGNVITETDQAGHVTKHIYDLAGRQFSVTQAYGTSNATTTTYAYDNSGRKTSEIDALTHTTTYTYDAAGNLTGVSGVNGSFTYTYDNVRNRVSMTDGNSNTTQYEYDARKRLVTTTYPDSTTRSNEYDGPGNLTSVTDQNGNVVEYGYDAANQLRSVTQTNSPNAPNNVTSYGYNVLGDITGLTDANSHLTENAFDLLSQPVSKTLPDGSLTETREYDAAGNLTSLKHFNSKTTTYSYDTLNRLLSRTPDPTSGEPAVSFTYTTTGKRASMTDASGTTNYTYDSMDRLITKATPEGTLNYTYDAAGHLASITSSHSNGVSVSYTYDSLNRLSTVGDGRLSGAQTTTYTYDTASNVATVTYPNTVQTAFTYDQLNRAKQLASSAQTGYLYTFDALGNRKTASEYNGRSVSWNFDGIYRLTSETITGAPSNKNGTASYVPDPVGNRTSATSSIPGLTPTGGTFNADDELASEGYDPDGNVTASGGKTFTYDTENHLMSMNGGAVAIIYDGDGNRVAKTVSGVTTRYLVDDLNPTGYAQVVEELSGSGSVQRQYTYGLQRISQNQVVSNTWTPTFYGYDGFGTVRQLTNSAGTITDTYDYDAFGNKINSTGSTPNNVLYRGEEYDSDLGLYYLRARYYNPLTGRFMSRDPEDGIDTDPKTLHKYMYAGGDPVNAFDPTGRAGQTATWGRPGIEYVGLVAAISFGVVRSAPLVAQAASCVFDTAASLLKGVTTNLGRPIVGISFDAGTCSAKVRKCKPCDPPVQAGDFGYQLHVGQESPHFDKASQTWIPGGQTHWHLFQCNQSPAEDGCICRWNKLKDMTGVGVTPPGFDVDTTSCSGGGIETE